MKILVALDNKNIKEELEKIYPNELYIHDITYKEGVIEFLSRNKEEFILITREDLQGNLDNRLYAKQIRIANENVRVIYIVKSLDTSYKEFLFSNEIFNIIEGESVSIDQIKEIIENGKDIIYKIQKNEKNQNNYQLQENINQIITKKIISIFGTSGSGKSFVSNLLAKKISNDFNLRTSLIDMDLQNPCLDIISNIDSNLNGLTNIIEDIDKNLDIVNNLNKYTKTSQIDKKLIYLMSNISLYDCQNKLSSYYYQKIYSYFLEKNDFILIDLPSTPFLDVVKYTLEISTDIFFIVNPNYISIRQAIKYLDLMDKAWNIPKSNIKIIINKNQKNSLDKIQIESLFREYEILSVIGYDINVEGFINGALNNIDIPFNTDNIYESIGIIKKQNKALKNNLIGNIFKKREVLNDY